MKVSQVSNAVKNSTKTIFKKLNGKPMTYASKAVGITALASVLYDAHINFSYFKFILIKFFNQYKQYMTREKSSATIAGLKKFWFNMQQNFPLKHLLPKTTGYLKGFGETIFSDIPLVLLSALSIKSKKLGKLSSVLLLISGAKNILYDVVGIGANKRRMK